MSIGLIAVLREGVCRKVTTFEALAISRNEIALTQGCADRLWEEISDRISTPAVQLLCTQLTFDAWIASASKRRTIEAAVAAGDAC